MPQLKLNMIIKYDTNIFAHFLMFSPKLKDRKALSMKYHSNESSKSISRIIPVQLFVSSF
jgi:hypothetical protein